MKKILFLNFRKNNIFSNVSNNNQVRLEENIKVRINSKQLKLLSNQN